MKKRKTLKGFTLIEMIIVVAVFGMIMAVVLSFLDPVRKVYTRSYVESDAQSISENMRRYIGDQIQYADRMRVYTGKTFDDTTLAGEVEKFREKYYFVPETGAPYPAGGGTGTKERTYPYASFKGNDEVFVLRIENPDPAIDFSTGSVTLPVAGSMLGRITLSTYEGGVFKDSRVWSENTDYYEDYAFDISLQTAISTPGTDSNGNPITENKFVDLDEAPTFTSGSDVYINPNNLVMGIKMYRKTPIKGNLTQASVEDSYVNRSITFRLKNLVTRTNALSVETIDFQDSVHFPTPEPVNRFEWMASGHTHATDVTVGTDSKDIYFIFTKVPYIENVI